MKETEPIKQRHALADVVLVKSDFIVINKHKFRILENYRDAVKISLLEQKYDPYLEKYDFLVGDLSSEKLRLKGFYQSNSPKISIDKKFDSLEDYLLEFVNPGAPYFVLESIEPKKTQISSKYKKPYREHKVAKTNLKGKQVDSTSTKQKQNHHTFVIKKRKTSES